MDVEDVFEKWDDSEMMDLEEIESVVGCEKERSKKCEKGKNSDGERTDLRCWATQSKKVWDSRDKPTTSRATQSVLQNKAAFKIETETRQQRAERLEVFCKTKQHLRLSI